jgi:hypothetical protein
MSKPLVIDRTLTVGMLITLAIQTASGLIWAGGIQTRVVRLEVEAKQTLPINIRLTRLEEQVSAAVFTLHRIETEISGRPELPHD